MSVSRWRLAPHAALIAGLVALLGGILPAGAAHAASPPPAPQALTVTAITSTSVSLSWQPPAGAVGVSGYQILRAQGRQSHRLRATVATTRFTDTGLNPSTSYSYVVRAVDAAGNVSLLSTVASAVTHRGAAIVPAGAACLVEYYPSGTAGDLTATVVLTDTGPATVDGWKLSWTVPAGTLVGTGGWGATLVQDGSTMTATSVAANATITPGDDVEFGYTSSGPDAGAPSGYAMNGSPCAVG